MSSTKQRAKRRKAILRAYEAAPQRGMLAAIAAAKTLRVNEALTAAQVPVPPSARPAAGRTPARPALMGKPLHTMSADEWAVYSGAMMDTAGEAMGMGSPIWRGVHA